DAVAAETGLSKTGRGRTPSFGMPLRAQFLRKGIYRYDKAVFGSYKDFVPNHYILGYHMVAQSRREYSTTIWNHAFDKVGKRPYMVVPFSEGIRDATGLSKRGLYDSTMNRLKNDWKKQSDSLTHEDLFVVRTPEKRIFTNYVRPHVVNDNLVIAEKNAMDDIGRFVMLDAKGNEKTLFTPGYYNSGSLSQAGNLVVWTEKEFDPRWENRSYSVIKIFDLNTGKTRKLTSKTRYFAPTLSPDAFKIVAVEVTEENIYFLVVLNVNSGQVIKRFSTPENYFFTYPSWSSDGASVVSVVVGDPGKSIVILQTASGSFEYVIPFTYTDISKPLLRGNDIFFIGAWSGIDNLYQLNTTTGQINKITSVEFGLTDPYLKPGGNEMLFSNYTENGYEISAITLDQTYQVPVENVTDWGPKLYHTLAEQDGVIMDPDSIPQTEYTSSNYSKLLNVFNFHSWAPLSIDASNYDVSPGFSLMSQNILSSAFTTLGYTYNLNENTGKYYLNFSYQGLYPVIDFQIDYGKRKSYTYDTTHQKINFSWMETNFTTAVKIPLNLTSGKYARLLQPSVDLTYKQLDMDKDAPVSFVRSNFKTISYRFYAYNLIKSVARDMYPRWGQMLDLNLRTAPFQSDTIGSMLAAETRLFFPGLFRHHSFNIYAGYQKRINNHYYYGNIVNYPRGFTGLLTKELKSISFNYKLPLFYPDFSLSSLAYFKRFKSNLFFDYATGNYDNEITDWYSAGIELFTDL
nr:hypothetical protein [Bacteroidota bacterium]